ncbi:MAG: hypothetical protein U1F43_23045 [Myxococcota bacterium]
MFQVAASIALALTASAPAWTLATPAPEGVDEVGPEVMADGGALVRVTLTYAASVDAAQLATRWIAAFEAAGWRVVDRADEGFDVVATLEKDDLRASFAVGRAYGGSAHGYGWLALGKARASAFQAPGPCLPIPRRGWAGTSTERRRPARRAQPALGRALRLELSGGRPRRRSRPRLARARGRRARGERRPEAGRRDADGVPPRT